MASTAFQTFQDLMQRNAYAEAAALADREALAARPGDAFWFSQLARALLRMKSWHEARRAAEKALEIQPGNGWALLALGEALFGAQETEKALDAFERAASAADARVQSRGREKACECLLRLKQWERLRAEASAAGLAEKERLRFEAHALHGMKRLDEAREACRQWLAAAPDNRGALWLSTEIDIETDGLEAVRERMGRLAKIPSRPPVYAEIYASLCRRAGVAGAAITQYDKLQSRGDAGRAMRQKAFLLAKSGQEAEAVAIMEELLRIDPADMYLHRAYGAACGRIGALERAVAFYTELAAANPGDKRLLGRRHALEKKLTKADDGTA